MARRQTRLWLTTGTVVIIGAVLAYTLWPRPVMVDLDRVALRNMVVTIDEEAKTQVRDAYVLSAPIAGRLLRVEVEAGDEVTGGTTTVARMLPLPPSALDVRTREQARAAVSAADAALRVGRADLNKAIADKDLADLDLARARRLRESGTLAQAALDRAEQAWRAANAALDTAKAAISMREAELANARSRLISFAERGAPGYDILESEKAIPLLAPVSGRILHVMQKSETTLAAGVPIMEIGDVSNDLEVIVELLSTDAVKVAPGNPVLIEKWGKPEPLRGRVERVEPWGFTKFSALGVEEQRVNAIIQFTDDATERAGLGHGFRVETRIVIWQSEAALTVPASALFRDKENWAVFVVNDGRARLQKIEIGQNNGSLAEVLTGLSDGDDVVLYPGPGIQDGTSVSQRQIVQ